MKLVSKKDSAVSPVIGTILLVAITVILVAIIAAVVMPMIGGVGQSHVAGIQVNTSAPSFTFVSGQMPDDLSIKGPSGDSPAIDGYTANTKAVVGEIYKLKGVTAGNTYSIIGKFGKDEQVLWTGEITTTVSA